MPISDTHRNAVEEVLAAVNAATGPTRGKRKLAEMFKELPDRDAWSEYYEVSAFLLANCSALRPFLGDKRA